MTFWVIATGIAAAVALTLIMAVWRARAVAEPAAAYDLRVYRDQLSEVDRDLARGVINESDADRVRTEVSRRILAADTAMQNAGQTARSTRGQVGVAVLTALLAAGSLALYARTGAPGYGDLALSDRLAAAQEARENRPDQNAAEDSLPPRPELTDINEDYLALVERLRDTVKNRPDDVQGYVLLARSEAQLGNFAAAYAAQEQVLRLKGDAASVEDRMTYAELMIYAAGGYVSPQAEDALRQVLVRDPENGSAQYYVGLMMAQTGRPDLAFQSWSRLLRTSPGDAPWVAPIRAQIQDIAMRAGVDYEPPAPAQPGPTEQDIEAAGDMSTEDRQDMIRGMVTRLSDRLATQGGTPDEWARLIGALGVLGDEPQSIAVYNNALEVFAGNDAALEVIRNGARQAGLIP